MRSKVFAVSGIALMVIPIVVGPLLLARLAPAEGGLGSAAVWAGIVSAMAVPFLIGYVFCLLALIVRRPLRDDLVGFIVWSIVAAISALIFWSGTSTLLSEPDMTTWSVGVIALGIPGAAVCVFSLLPKRVSEKAQLTA